MKAKQIKAVCRAAIDLSSSMAPDGLAVAEEMLATVERAASRRKTTDCVLKKVQEARNSLHWQLDRITSPQPLR